ncbi:glycosyltransferase family 2 protein [Streptomyces sp. NPDC006638]|uniref:glycosyltransferase family 2 protein n=1 Tax=Streptomyces sp. NPDC006638 TaxID=3157183 RepID=UPI0033AC8724
MTVVRLVSVVGGDTSLLPHMLAHYEGLGVEAFHVIRHVESGLDPTLASSVEAVRDAGHDFTRLSVGPWHEHLNPRLIRETMAEHPDDWWVVADLDEFQVYPDSLKETVAHCERHGFDYVEGAFLDRVAADGSFPDPEPYGSVPLWRQYPLAGLVTLRLMGARPTKVPLARGRVELGYGQHNSWTGRGAPAEHVYAQVHHFKWTASARERLARRVAAYSSGEWHINNAKIIDESRAFLDHVAAHQGRLRVDDPRLGFQRCALEYGGYAGWSDLTATLSRQYVEFDAARAATGRREAG